MVNKELTTLLDLIESWSVDLKLNVNSSPDKQVLKLYEEFGELAKSIQKNDTVGIMDGIGDVTVVATVMLSQCRNNIKDINYLNSPIHCKLQNLDNLVELNTTTDIFSKTCEDIYGYFSYCNFSYNEKEVEGVIFKLYAILIQSLNRLSRSLHIDFTECVKMAYITISHRSGKIIDGVFVKKVPNTTLYIPIEYLKHSTVDLTHIIYDYLDDNRLDYIRIEFTDESKHISHETI